MRRNPGLVLFAGSALLLGATVWAPALRDAFFVYDDFAHLDLCQRHVFADVFRQTMVSTFRPVAFGSLWAEFRFFGWEWPAGYVVVTALLFLLNAALLWRVLLAFGETALVSGLAATFFLLFPATIEVRVWPACRFDALCATGVLLSLLAWAGALRSETRCGWRFALALIAVTFFFLALLAKEPAVGLLALLPVLAMERRRRPRCGSRAGVGIAVGSLALATLVFLVVRSRVMPLTSTHYGEAVALFRGAPLLEHIGAFAKGFAAAPYFEAPSAVCSLVRVSGFLGVAGIISGLWSAGALAGAGFCLASGAFLGLVIWMPFVPGGAGGGRLLYMPSLPAAILFGIGVAAALETPAALRDSPIAARAARAAAVVLVAGFVLGSLASGSSAGGRWREAARLSRSVMAQAEAKADAPALFLKNVPWGFRDGPPVMSCYAFPAYLGRRGARVPLFRCDGVIVERGWRATIEWTPRRPDPYSQYSTPREDEAAVELDLQKSAPAGG